MSRRKKLFWHMLHLLCLRIICFFKFCYFSFRLSLFLHGHLLPFSSKLFSFVYCTNFHSNWALPPIGRVMHSAHEIFSLNPCSRYGLFSGNAFLMLCRREFPALIIEMNSRTSSEVHTIDSSKNDLEIHTKPRYINILNNIFPIMDISL
jgi:hypothetical protein